MDNDSNKNVCIIGAGIAGLVTAKTLVEDGFNVLVLEKDSNIGGTWSPTRAYPGLRANNSKYTYAFSGLSYPEDVDKFPYAEDIYKYLEAYADHFNIRNLISCNSEVIDVYRSQNNPDCLTVEYQSTDSIDKKDFDFVVICTGVFHKPKIPDVEGKERFSGRILHSSEVTESTYNKGEKVFIIGGGKSAYDCATWAAQRGYSPTLLYRRPQWMVPRYLPVGNIPGDFLVTSRFLTYFLKYYHSSKAKRFFYSLCKPLVWLWWKITETGWRKDLNIPPDLNPEEKLPNGMEKAGVGDDFYTAVNNNLAKAIRGSIKRFSEKEIELKDGTRLEADLVIFATGWHQDIPILNEELRQDILGGAYIRLYRHILPPNVPNIGFIGQASSYACTLTFEAGAHWLCEYLHGSLQLPAKEEMDHEINQFHEWAEIYEPNRGTEGFIGFFIHNYIDDLLADMGLNTKRENGFIKEYFTLFSPKRLEGLGQERQLHRVIQS